MHVDDDSGFPFHKECGSVATLCPGHTASFAVPIEGKTTGTGFPIVVFGGSEEDVFVCELFFEDAVVDVHQLSAQLNLKIDYR